MASENESPQRASVDRKKLGLRSAAAIVAASMIGSGVYTTSGFTIASLKEPHWVLAAWAVGGLVAICGALCYGGLAKDFTESGGEYLFLSRTVHPIAGLMAGWVSLLAGFTAPIALAATTFETYVNSAPWMEGMQWGENRMAVVLVVIAAIVHTIGVRRGAWVQDVAVMLKLAMITLFLVVSFTAIGSWPGWQQAAEANIEQSTTVAATTTDAIETDSDAPAALTSFGFVLAFATQLTWISLSYSGFNAAVYVSSEVREPGRNVPRALLLGTILVSLIYLLLNFVFVYAPTVSTIEGKSNVATLAAAAVGEGYPAESLMGGGRLAEYVRAFILCGLFTSVSAFVMTGPRVYAKMAEDGFMPRLMGFQGEVPIVGIWIQACLAILVIYLTTLKDLLGYLGLTLSLGAALSASVVFVLHRRSDSSVHVPLFPVPPIVFVGGTISIGMLTGIASPKSAIVTVATLLIGLAVYPWYRRRKSHSPD